MTKRRGLMHKCFLIVGYCLAHTFSYPKPGGSAVRALDTRPKGPRFNFQPGHYEVTTLGKLFTPMCLCRCKCLVVGVE